MLEELRQKLLSSRDKFILSNRDTLPDLDPSMQRKLNPSLIKQSSMGSDKGQTAKVKDERGATAENNGTRQAIVFTGQAEKRNAAIKQIKETFEQSKEIYVGAQKLDHRGRPIKGVTAVTVKDVLPMHQAHLNKLCMVVNTDEDLAKTVMDAGDVNNGHILH